MKHTTCKRVASSFALSALLSASMLAKEVENNLIKSVTVERNRVSIAINEEFKKKYLMGDFFAEFDEDINLEKLPYAINIMPFIMNVVSIVWISGQDYYIDEMDAKLYASLEKVKAVIERMFTKTKWRGRLIPRRLINTPRFFNESISQNRVALLFSGGLDSVTSSLYHRHEKQLLVTVWGHWDLPLHDKKLWETRKKELEAFGKEHGHENAFIRSNYYSFLNRNKLDHISPEISSWRIFTVEGIGWAGLAAPLMLLKGYPVLLHGSTITWEYNYPAAANPFIDNNIAFSNARVEHDLFDMNRLQKCEYIANLKKKKSIQQLPYIRVCEDQKIVGNCCKCQKCIRTILELIVIGEEPRDYGFKVDAQAIIQQSRKFMSEHSNGATTVWHFMHIQRKLQERVAHGEHIPEGLQWILHYNFKGKITADIKNQRSIDWRDFEDLLPNIVIPEPLERAFG